MEWTADGGSSSKNFGSPIQNFTSGLKSRDWKLPHADSGQNSLEYWDYTVELEMLKGPADLQLAAELGKTLLERNRELEANIKQLQTVNDDQTLEIEYLSKQTAALREVNDSRLRIYEQLEISIQDLEKNNQRLTAENVSDKRKIKSLSDTIEQLESKCDDLQKTLDDTKLAQQQEEHRGRAINKKVAAVEDNIFYRRSISCENSSQISEELLNEFTDLKLKYENCQEKLRILQVEKLEATKGREEIEIELSCVVQENNVLMEQLAVLKEKKDNIRCLEDELASLDDTTSSRLCRKCMGLTDDTASNQTMQDFNDDIEELEYDGIGNDCAVIKLKNGGYAWGSQESLASLSNARSCGNSVQSSPKREARDVPDNSLLSELDTQYRILIEKYEALVESREHKPKESFDDHKNNLDAGINSGSISLMMTDIAQKTNISMRCQRCTTCTCDLKPTDARPKSNMEEFSEVETSSSGFSEGESRVACKFTQTDVPEEIVPQYIEDTLTPIAFTSMKCLDLTSPLNPCERRFQNTPQYKHLFKDIFDVLKKTVNESEAQKAFTRSIMQSQLVYMSRTKSSENVSEDRKSIKETAETIFPDENEENLNPNKENKINKEEKIESNKKVNKSETKPNRPQFLDLNSSSASTGRSASRSRRKKRRQRHDSQKSDLVTVDRSGETSEGVTKSLELPKAKNDQAARESSKNTEEVPLTKYRCKHNQRNKKHRERQIANKHLSLVTEPDKPSILLPSVETKKAAFSHPSVEVAKLRRLEMTYAEVLKNRRCKERRF